MMTSRLHSLSGVFLVCELQVHSRRDRAKKGWEEVRGGGRGWGFRCSLLRLPTSSTPTRWPVHRLGSLFLFQCFDDVKFVFRFAFSLAECLV